MNVQPIKTRKFRPPRDDLPELLASSLPALPEGAIVAISSKIVSIGEGRCLPIESIADKDALIAQEADRYLDRGHTPGRWVMHTLKQNLLMPSAGIDESNGAGHYILWPEDPFASAHRIWHFLRQHFGRRHLGIVITDSHSIPLRKGLVGLALAFWGFQPLRDYRKRPDVFGRPLRISRTDLADGLAAAAVLVMGEGNEQTPIVVITDAPGIRFVARLAAPHDPAWDLGVTPELDLYRPFLDGVPWQGGGGGYRSRSDNHDSRDNRGRRHPK